MNLDDRYTTLERGHVYLFVRPLPPPATCTSPVDPENPEESPDDV